MKEWFEAFSERLYFWGRENVLFLALFSKLMPGQYRRIMHLLGIIDTRVKPIHPFTADGWYRTSSSYQRCQLVREDMKTGKRYVFTYAWKSNGPVVKSVGNQLDEFLIRNNLLPKIDIDTFNWVKHSILPLANRILGENCSVETTMFGQRVSSAKDQRMHFVDGYQIEITGLYGKGSSVLIRCPNVEVKQELLQMDALYQIFKIIYGDEFIFVNLTTFPNKTTHLQNIPSVRPVSMS